LRRSEGRILSTILRGPLILKYDGFRALCYLEQGSCRLISRNGNLMTRFPGLGDQIAA
jgi:hypothetical protein